MSISSRLVCWNCRRHDVTLHNVRDEYGFKSEDYVCDYCLPLFPKPTRKNMSREFLPTKEQIERIQQVLTEATQPTPPSEPALAQEEKESK